MEPDDIGVVMTRASELHASICDAIERVSQSRHLGDGLLDNGAAYDDDEAGVGGSSFEEEVRSLECIRDALEVLETQLESLQVPYALASRWDLAVVVEQKLKCLLYIILFLV